MNNEQEKKTGSKVEKKQIKQVLTIYFTEELIDSMDDLIHTARKEMPEFKRRKLNRTFLLQLLLDEIILDYSLYQKESFVWRLLLSSKENESKNYC